MDWTDLLDSVREVFKDRHNGRIRLSPVVVEAALRHLLRGPVGDDFLRTVLQSEELRNDIIIGLIGFFGACLVKLQDVGTFHPNRGTYCAERPEPFFRKKFRALESPRVT